MHLTLVASHVNVCIYPSGLSALSTSILREYHYIKILKTWAEAQTYCRENFIDLATVNNQDDNDRLQSVFEDPGTFVWIGLQDEFRWKWTLGDADFNMNTDFSHWKLSEPNNVGSNQHCGVINEESNWLDFTCTSTRPSVCYDGKLFFFPNTKLKIFFRYCQTGSGQTLCERFPSSWTYCLKDTQFQPQQEMEIVVVVIVVRLSENGLCSGNHDYLY